MADLRRSRFGVNLLVTALDRHLSGADPRGHRYQEIDAQVDHRDRQGRTQTNPHLATRRQDTPHGPSMPSTTELYAAEDVDAIASAAGEDGSFELRGTNGQRIGMLYAVKADVVPLDAYGDPSRSRPDIDSLRPSDFDVDLGTREAQFQNMLRMRGEGMDEVVAARGHDTYLRERQSQAFRDGDGVDGISTEDEIMQHQTTLTADERAQGVRPVRLDTVELREARTAEQKRLMPDLDHGGSARPSDGPRPRPQTATRAPASSQAGLSGIRAGAQFGSAPPPGQPGSRFNPIVRERGEARRSSASDAQRANDMHHFRDDRTGQVISMGSARLAKKGQPEGSRRMSAEEYRLHREDVHDGPAQRDAGRAGPGAGPAQPSRTPASDRSAFAADVLGRTGKVLDGKAPAPEQPTGQEARPLSERFAYRFDDPESSSGTEPQPGD